MIKIIFLFFSKWVSPQPLQQSMHTTIFITKFNIQVFTVQESHKYRYMNQPTKNNEQKESIRSAHP
jgi:hypothetical protein